MFKTFVIIFFLSFSISKDYVLVLYPDANLSNTEKLNASDVDAIYFLFQEGFKNYSNIEIIEPTDQHFCSSKECAVSLGEQYGANQVVTSKIRVLGSKIIFTGMIVNLGNNEEFTSRVTALNVEDMENASLRLAKSLINKDSIEESVDIDNIIEEETMADSRREGIYKIGFNLGYLVPFGGEGYKYWEEEFGDLTLSKTILQIGWINYWEQKNNSFVMAEAFLNAANQGAGGFGLEINMNKYINRTDTSPFYGAGIGWYMNTLNVEKYHDNNYYWGAEPRHGVALTAQAGYTFLRTYNMNIFVRAKYHILVTTGEGNIDNGISFNVGLVRKLTPNKNTSFASRDRVEYRYPILEILLGMLK
ncbi:hypothetical protein OAI93_00880 [bacterium]|nr:hypothetical protein [bacterium]